MFWLGSFLNVLGFFLKKIEGNFETKHCFEPKHQNVRVKYFDIFRFFLGLFLMETNLVKLTWIHERFQRRWPCNFLWKKFQSKNYIQIYLFRRAAPLFVKIGVWGQISEPHKAHRRRKASSHLSQHLSLRTPSSLCKETILAETATLRYKNPTLAILLCQR